MFDEIEIRGVGVIEEATLRLDPGFTVLTGETGAGKTLVVTSLELLLGARADAGLVRAGAEGARIEARVRPVPEDAVAAGYAEPDDDELIVVREISPGDDGARSRVRIGGRLAPVGALRDVLGRWVEVHTQGSHVRLGLPAVQRELLDRYAGPQHLEVLDEYRRAFRAWMQARDELERITAGERERARELDRLKHEIAEIDAAGIDPDLDASIEDEIDRLEHAEELLHAAQTAVTALGEGGAGAPLGELVAVLRAASAHDSQLADLLARAEGLAAEAADLRLTLRSYGESLALDPEQLETMRTRRRLLADLLRKYGEDLQAVIAYGESAAARAAVLTQEQDGLGDLSGRVEALMADATAASERVRSGRRAAADRLAASVAEHLEELAMPEAAFEVRVEPVDALGPDGSDEVRMLLAPNPGEPSRPIADAVSGGERSRVALAVEVALADVDAARVLVFDEVDAGVGGAAALKVGEKLARLAAGIRPRQVICVTHLAQLAAFADRHHVVEKAIVDGRTLTSVRSVDEPDRAEELARMLSGSKEREVGVAHAHELLRDAQRLRESA